MQVVSICLTIFGDHAEADELAQWIDQNFGLAAGSVWEAEKRWTGINDKNGVAEKPQRTRDRDDEGVSGERTEESERDRSRERERERRKGRTRKDNEKNKERQSHKMQKKRRKQRTSIN